MTYRPRVNIRLKITFLVAIQISNPLYAAGQNIAEWSSAMQHQIGNLI
jgi:hypothetical protein